VATSTRDILIHELQVGEVEMNAWMSHQPAPDVEMFGAERLIRWKNLLVVPEQT
jgi:hypothetical protein